MGYGDTFNYFNYVSDNGKTYCVKMSTAVAAQGGLPVTNAPSTAQFWFYHQRDLRHVTGVSSSGKRAHIPCGTPNNTLFTAQGGSFTLHGVAYTIESSIGERRDIRHIK
jgi:hypothetical protein